MKKPHKHTKDEGGYGYYSGYGEPPEWEVPWPPRCSSCGQFMSFEDAFPDSEPLKKPEVELPDLDPSQVLSLLEDWKEGLQITEQNG